MENLKSTIIEKFANDINSLDFSLDETSLQFKYNSIVESIYNTILIKREKLNISSENVVQSNDFNLNFDAISAGKSFDTTLSNNEYMSAKQIKKELNPLTKIPNNFSLTYEMKEFAKSKHIPAENIESIFEDFVIHYQENGNENKNWDLMWKKWVKRSNTFKNHLPSKELDPNFKLTDTMIELVKDLIVKDQINIEFEKFKSHHIAKGTLKANWKAAWKSWCINHKQFIPKAPREQTAKQKEKADYKWDFRKAKEVSDRIKNWLRFEKKINWLDDYYWKDIPIPGIGWQKVMHPDFNKEEIILFKIDSTDGNFMLQHKTNDIIDAEVLEND